MKSTLGKKVLSYLIDKALDSGQRHAGMTNGGQAGIAGAVPNEPVGMGSPTLPDNPLEGTIYNNPPVPQIRVDDELQRKIDAINEAIATGKDVKEVLEKYGM